MRPDQRQAFLDTYVAMLSSRESDIVEAELVNSGEASFLASSEGHEGGAVLNSLLIKSDYLHPHYRDKSLMLARGVTSEMVFYSALHKAESSSAGRPMVTHLSAPELNILSLVGPVGNGALHTVGIAQVIKDQVDRPLVLSGLGDGSSQQGEVMEAIAEAERSEAPVLFFIHNNDLAISTRTKGQTFFSLLDGTMPTSFHGVPITHIDGMRPFESFDALSDIVAKIRETRKPQIVIFNVDRLANHSNADNQKLYRSDEEIKRSHGENDPINLSRHYLLQHGISEEELDALEVKTKQRVRAAVDVARMGTQPKTCMDASRALPKEVQRDAPEYRGDFDAEERLSMLAAMRDVFDHQLGQGDDVYLIGEDVEDGKGDVFGTTKGLSTKYPGRVVNSALTESMILGVATGMALVGKRPVAFMQFADFMPLAYNQIASELGMMHWRSNGGWNAPVIVFAACGAYRPGLGPYHSQTNEATYANIPGIDVFMPSNAADAAGMLNAAFKSGRPSVFLYPKKLLNNGSVQDTTSNDVARQIVPVGKARIVKAGQDVTLVGWGNTVEFCKEVAETLETVGVDAEIIDLRCMSPIDVETITASARKTGALVVTHEDNQTCGMASEIITLVLERSDIPVKVRRVTRPDTYTPCNFVNQLEVLPSYGRILEAACEVLDIHIQWEEKNTTEAGTFNVEVIGASPSDETVVITDVHVSVGDEVKAGDCLVDTEASKSAGEILAPITGTIEEIYVEESDQAVVGEPLLKLRLPEGSFTQSAQVKRIPVLEQKGFVIEPVAQTILKGHSTVFPVGIATPVYKTGSRLVKNEEILKNFPEKTSQDIVNLTGIEQRYWLGEGESIIDLAADASIELLTKQGLHLSDIDVIICATCTPEKFVSPSMACLVLHKLYETYGEQSIQAHDVNAACSGYLYAMQQAKDLLQIRPHARVLLLTAEALTNRLDVHDFDTAFLFGDAATASLLVGSDHIDAAVATIDHVFLSAVAEDGSILNIPVVKTESQAITLNGRKLFTFAVKTMALIMHKCCQQAGMELSEIDLVVPHQANQRISSAIEKRLKMMEGSMYSNISRFGNTSSCTIPIALSETLGVEDEHKKVALCAFGSGFTSGAAILSMR
jgi:2-oxoisovalerate dehydrogenase E1 component